jgi:hypothetical protein
LLYARWVVYNPKHQALIRTPGKNINEVAGNIVDGDSKKPISEVTVTAYSANKKKNL